MKTSAVKLTLRDLFIATAVVALSIAVSLPVYSIYLEPHAFADSLPHPMAAMVMYICTFGIVGFPLICFVLGLTVMWKMKSLVKILILVVLLAFGVCSVPIALAIARACAGAIA